jgi:hypothetical protein
MKPSIFRTLTAFAVLGSASAFGHAVLTYPTPRTSNANLKAPPCGLNLAAPTSVATFQPGQTVVVQWAETVNHPGHYELDFGRNIDGTFDGGFTPLLQPDAGALNNIANPNGTQANNMAMVKLPTQPCPLCQIRLRQYMSDNTSLWYLSCSDITIAAPPGMDAGTPTQDAGTGVADAGTQPVQDSGTTVEPVVDSGTTMNPLPKADSGATMTPAGTNPGNNNTGKSADAEPAGGCSAAGGSLLTVLALVSLAIAARKKRPH